MQPEFRIVLSMAAMRFIAGALEITAALLMLRFAKVHAAMKINAVLGDRANSTHDCQLFRINWTISSFL